MGSWKIETLVHKGYAMEGIELLIFGLANAVEVRGKTAQQEEASYPGVESCRIN
jgi:hypothetical protein